MMVKLRRRLRAVLLMTMIMWLPLTLKHLQEEY
jgi:hypothetical protein